MPELAHKKVLIVDPSPIFRRTLKDVIQTTEPQVEIHEADSAAQAKAILKNESSDVIFIELALPQNNGIELIETVKEMVPNIRIVVLTNHDSAEHKEASFRKGANYFLSKERSGGLRLLDVIHSTIQRLGAA